MYVISPRLMVEEADATIERIQGLVEDTGGEILMTDNWGRRRLAYPIKHHFEGHLCAHAHHDAARSHRPASSAR